MPSILPVSIDLHVKCPFQRNQPFLSKIFTWHLGSQYLYALKFVSHGAVKTFLNVRNLQRCACAVRLFSNCGYIC